MVAYASRALSPVEQRYPQTDREGLAVVWGCEHFHLYIYGRPVTVVTDHKPPLGIFNNPKSKPPVRLERYANRLDTYQAILVYRPGADNPADYMSHHPLTGPHADPEDEDAGDVYVNFVAAHAVPKAMRVDENKSATLSDSTLQEVASCVRSGRWHDPYPEGVDPTDISSLSVVMLGDFQQHSPDCVAGSRPAWQQTGVPAMLSQEQPNTTLPHHSPFMAPPMVSPVPEPPDQTTTRPQFTPSISMGCRFLSTWMLYLMGSNLELIMGKSSNVFPVSL